MFLRGKKLIPQRGPFAPLQLQLQQARLAVAVSRLGRHCLHGCPKLREPRAGALFGPLMAFRGKGDLLPIRRYLENLGILSLNGWKALQNGCIQIGGPNMFAISSNLLLDSLPNQNLFRVPRQSTRLNVYLKIPWEAPNRGSPWE